MASQIVKPPNHPFTTNEGLITNEIQIESNAKTRLHFEEELHKKIGAQDKLLEKLQVDLGNLTHSLNALQNTTDGAYMNVDTEQPANTIDRSTISNILLLQTEIRCLYFATDLYATNFKLDS